ncbi:hypothetical protein ABPG74_004404 [Tetrahymena malaccensis]
MKYLKNLTQLKCLKLIQQYAFSNIQLFQTRKKSTKLKCSITVLFTNVPKIIRSLLISQLLQFNYAEKFIVFQRLNQALQKQTNRFQQNRRVQTKIISAKNLIIVRSMHQQLASTNNLY